jgi:hypothetical protein
LLHVNRCIVRLPHAGWLFHLLQGAADDSCQLWAVAEQRMQVLFWTATVAALQLRLLLLHKVDGPFA